MGAEAGWGREGKKRRKVGLQTELEQRKREGEGISILGINPSYATHFNPYYYVHPFARWHAINLEVFSFYFYITALIPSHPTIYPMKQIKADYTHHRAVMRALRFRPSSWHNK